MKKKRRGRPMSSNDVTVTPEFREKLDIEKLGQVVLALAASIAEKERAAKQGSQGDDMT